MSKPDLVAIEVTDPVLYNTDRAILVLIDGEKRWIPMSIIGEDSDVWVKGDTGTLYLPKWFCEKEGIET
jgi:hypothetical protein